MPPAFRTVALVAAFCGISCAVLNAAPAANPEVTRLTEGFVEVRRLAPEDVKSYVASLGTGEVLHLRVRQRGLDVEVVLPDDDLLLDLFLGDHVTEELWWLAESERELRIDVHALAGTGDYQLSVEKLAPANGVDRLRARAFQLVREQRFASALELWRETKTPAQAALTWDAVGNLRQRQSDSAGALAAFAAAVEFASAAPEEHLLGPLLVKRGQTQRTAWNLDEAVADYRKAEALATESEDVFGLAWAVNNLAIVDDVRGNLGASCTGFERARDLYRQAARTRQTVIAQLNLGHCLMKIGEMPRALELLEESLRLASSSVPGRRLRALQEIGWWYRLQGQPQKALGYFLEGLYTPRQTRYDAAQLTTILDHLGTVYVDLGEYIQARQSYYKALNRTTDIVDRGHIQVNLCRLEEMSGKISEGLRYCAQALPVFEKIRASGTIAEIRGLLARLERRKERFGEAERHADEALRHVEWQRTLIADDEKRLAFQEQRQDVYQLLIDLRMDLHALEPAADWDARALEVAELTRARNLIDLLSEDGVDPSRQVDPRLLHEERQLRAKIEKHLEKYQRKEEPAAATIEGELRRLEEQLATVRRRLREVAPSYAALTHPRLLDVEGIQNLLDEDTLLLVYHLGEPRSYVWSVDHREVQGAPLPSKDTIERRTEAWYRLLASAEMSWTEGSLERYRAERQSRLLLEHAATEIGRHRRIVIVASGALQRLPFGALPSPVAGEEGLVLIARHEIVMLPSAALLAVLRQQAAGREPANGFLAVVADPVYGFGDERLASGSRLRSTAELARLVGSADEARDLLALAGERPVKLLDGFAARREDVLAGALNGFRIVHFATHALTRLVPRQRIGLVLSQVDKNGREVDGLVGLQDIYGLDLPAELAVLSACSTVLGKDVAGEGLVGLTRGFMHAGTPRVVVSLWDVQDSAAREFMRRFYSALLKDGEAPGEALRQTQASMLQDGWAVRDWAAFVLQGEWRPFPVDDR